MADEKERRGSAKARQSLQSPEDLEAYVQVTPLRVWVILGACIALIVALLIWGFFGTITTTLRVTTVYTDDSGLLGFVSGEEASKVKVGNPAFVEGHQLDVYGVSSTAISKTEGSAYLFDHDYLSTLVFEGDWAYPITFVNPGYAKRIDEAWAACEELIDDPNASEEQIDAALDSYMDVSSQGTDIAYLNLEYQKPYEAIIITEEVNPISLVLG